MNHSIETKLKKELFGFRLFYTNLKHTVNEKDSEETYTEISGKIYSSKDISHYRFTITENLLELHIPKLGKFKAESGKRITVSHNNADIKLWKKSFDILNKSEKRLMQARNQTKEYNLPLKNERLIKYYSVYKIYIIHTHNKESIELSEPLKGKQKFDKIEHHAYRRKFFNTDICLLSCMENSNPPERKAFY